MMRHHMSCLLEQACLAAPASPTTSTPSSPPPHSRSPLGDSRPSAPGSHASVMPGATEAAAATADAACTILTLHPPPNSGGNSGPLPCAGLRGHGSGGSGGETAQALEPEGSLDGGVGEAGVGHVAGGVNPCHHPQASHLGCQGEGATAPISSAAAATASKAPPGHAQQGEGARQGVVEGQQQAAGRPCVHPPHVQGEGVGGSKVHGHGPSGRKLEGVLPGGPGGPGGQLCQGLGGRGRQEPLGADGGRRPRQQSIHGGGSSQQRRALHTSSSQRQKQQVRVCRLPWAVRGGALRKSGVPGVACAHPL